jgi:hypothetical protein
VLPLALTLSTGEVILIIVLATTPIALATFVLGAGDALRQIGKGPLGVEFDSDMGRPITDDAVPASPELRETEIRQLVEAKAYRQRARGETVLDVEAEVRKALGSATDPAPQADPQLAAEVRQLVVARNERRLRQGKEPLDVEHEVARQLRELESLGQ